MKRFMITYLGGDQPATPEEGKQHFAKYMAWIKANEAVIDSPANPLKGMQTVHPDGSVVDGGETHMSGFTIVKVSTQEEAIEVAKTCPFLEIGGRLEVAEILQMPGLA